MPHCITGKLTQSDLRVTAFNYHVTKGVIKRTARPYGLIWCAQEPFHLVPLAAPLGQHSCYDANPTDEETEAQRSQEPHPRAMVCGTEQDWLQPGPELLTSYNTLSEWLFSSLFHLCGHFCEQQCFSRRSQKETTTKTKPIRNTFQL